MTHSLNVLNPFNGQVVDQVACTSVSDVGHLLAIAQQGAVINKQLARHQRAEILGRAAVLVRNKKSQFIDTIIAEAGKPFVQAQKEVDRCINTLTLSAEEAKRNAGELLPFDAYVGSENRRGYYTHDPLGIILAITPFNDPLNLVAHKLGPANASGNSVILKPSEHTPLSALLLVDTLYQAGLPKAIVSTAVGDAQLAKALVAAKDIRMVSFTGGVTTGEAIVRTAGLKKMSMDLGGNAPVIVLDDCDLNEAVDACVSGAYWAAGQNCIGVQRIVIQQSIYAEFVQQFVEKTNRLKVGNPADKAMDMGPLINASQAERVERWVSQAVEQGASVLAGHKREGAFYWPTVLVDVPDEAIILCEEIFGPVAILQSVTDLTQAIRLANAPDFSLHAGIFTRDLEAALSAAEQLEAGGVMVNDSSDYRFDAMPFGGYKYGSMGREGVRFAMQEMSQTKVVCFNRPVIEKVS